MPISDDFIENVAFKINNRPIDVLIGKYLMKYFTRNFHHGTKSIKQNYILFPPKIIAIMGTTIIKTGIKKMPGIQIFFDFL